MGPDRNQRSDASNLAEVIQNLQDTPDKFLEFMGLVSRVIPHVKQISARNIGSGKVELFTSTYERQLGRDDLFVSLQHSGSGVGQVIAILYGHYRAHATRISHAERAPKPWTVGDGQRMTVEV